MTEQIPTEEEIEDLKKWVPQVIEDYRKKGITTIVGLDKSGRPIAKLVWQAWRRMYPDEKPKLFFINPGEMRGDLEREGELSIRLLEDTVNVLRKKSPQLYKRIEDNPSKIGIVDEYSGMGRAERVIKQLFSEIKEGNPVFSAFRKGGMNVSWYDKPHLKGVQKKVLGRKILSELYRPYSEKRREEMVRFRKRFSNLANDIAREHRAKQLIKPHLGRRGRRKASA